MLSLPPGPKPWPVIGNLAHLPLRGQHADHWAKHQQLYGPITSVSIFGLTMVVIHDRYILNELLEKHSLATSGRPQMRFAGDLCGFNRYLFTSDYNAFAREQRKVMHREIGTDKLARRFEDSQDIESRRLLLRTLNHPKQLFSLHVPL